MLKFLWNDYHISMQRHGSRLYKRLYSLEGAHPSHRPKKYHQMDDWQVYVSYRIHRYNLMLWFALLECFPFICFSILHLKLSGPSTIPKNSAHPSPTLSDFSTFLGNEQNLTNSILIPWVSSFQPFVDSQVYGNILNIIVSSIFILWHLFLYSYHTLRWMHLFLFLLISHDLGALFSGYNEHKVWMVPSVLQWIIEITTPFAMWVFMSWTLRNAVPKLCGFSRKCDVLFGCVRNVHNTHKTPEKTHSLTLVS